MRGRNSDREWEGGRERERGRKREREGGREREHERVTETTIHGTNPSQNIIYVSKSKK